MTSWPTNGWPTAGYTREKAYVQRVLDVFEREHPDRRVVRMRPGFVFKREAASEQRRLFAGPLVPRQLVRPGLVPIVPDLPGLRFQALHAADAGEGYRQAVIRPVHGAFNLASDPPLDAGELARLLRARTVPWPAPGICTWCPPRPSFSTRCCGCPSWTPQDHGPSLAGRRTTARWTPSVTNWQRSRLVADAGPQLASPYRRE